MARAKAHKNVAFSIPLEDFKRLERYASKQRLSKNALLLRQIFPLQETLRELDEQQEDTEGQ